jgi:hypothetical protein
LDKHLNPKAAHTIGSVISQVADFIDRNIKAMNVQEIKEQISNVDNVSMGVQNSQFAGELSGSVLITIDEQMTNKTSLNIAMSIKDKKVHLYTLPSHGKVGEKISDTMQVGEMIKVSIGR